MLSDVELTQYLNAKFCHELAGTIGAINNGIEFLSDANESMKAKATELVQISAKQARARLLFYRQAYGIAKETGEADLAETKQVIEDFLQESKVNLEFSENSMFRSGVFINTNTVKLVLCLVVLAHNALLHGGTIEIKLDKVDHGKQVTVRAKGRNIKNDEDKKNILLGNLQGIQISSSNIHAYYTMRLKEKLDATLKVVDGDGYLDYIIQQS